MDSSLPKIYNETSVAISELKRAFIPIVNHLIKFLDYWVANNPTYAYDIVRTKRSWYCEKKITTLFEDRKNGLSWYLYGNAISINVYNKTSDQIIDTSSTNDYIKTSLNFDDGSATTFIKACQDWFSANLLDGNVVKIFGVYPSIIYNVKADVNDLLKKYVDDPYVIYWGGLFSGYSNFSHWEWHPGLAPNEISTMRDDFLNTIYDNYDILTALDNEIPYTGNTYLSDDLEIVEEDYLSLWKLKCEINLKKEYTIISLITWAQNNKYSLKEAIIYYSILGDYNNKQLFQILYDEADSYTFDENNNIVNSGSLIFYEDDSGNTYFYYYNEFEEKITISTNTIYIMPTDYLPTKDDFDLVELTMSDSSDSVYNNTLSNISESKIAEEINKTSSAYTDIRFEINEHGLIGDLGIDPTKLINDIDTAKTIANSMTIFEEMITPPNRDFVKTTRGVIDISQAIKYSTNATSFDEMITPPEP